MVEPQINMSPEQQELLLKVALGSIEHGLEYRQALPVDPRAYPSEFQSERAVFVTLTVDDRLRGCVGTLEPNDALVANVAKYAFAAAFSDSRFSPLARSEFPTLKVHISILSGLQPVQFSSEEDLRRQLRPGLDGLLLEEGRCRGTLLPSVWEDIPEPGEFLRRLKMKAGLPPHYWSNGVKVSRYTTVYIG